MHPSIGLTPERLTGILQQAEFGDPYLYLELAEEMEEKDLHYLAVLGTRKNAVAQLDLDRAGSVERRGRSARGRDGARDDLRRADTARQRAVRYSRRGGQGILGDRDNVGYLGREWFPAQLKWRDPRWFAFDWISGEELLVRTLEGRNDSR